MNDKRLGRQTVALAHPPSVLSFSNIGGKFEGQGPLADFFDEISNDSFFGEKTWEKAESAMQKTVLQRALEKAELTPEDLDYILAGDLLNQCIGSSFGLRDFRVPFYGLYGACSTMGESLTLASLLLGGGQPCRGLLFILPAAFLAVSLINLLAFSTENLTLLSFVTGLPWLEPGLLFGWLGLLTGTAVAALLPQKPLSEKES